MNLDGQTYDEATVSLETGNLLLLYTDGITEAASPASSGIKSTLFGTDRVDEVLLKVGAASAEECIARIRSAVAEFCANSPPTDDQTLIALRCL